jgi:uncharacterized membrane protein
MDWSLEPLFGSYLAVAVVGVGLVFVLFAIRETTQLSRWQAIALWSLRFITCLLLLAVLLKPGVTFVKQSSPEGTVAILMDASASMLLPAGDGAGSRWDATRTIWEQIWKSREAFGKETKLLPFLYDASLKPLQEKEGVFGNASPRLPESPQGITTDIGGPLTQLMAYPMEAPLSAVIWLGDGSQTHTPSGGDPQQLARRLAQIDVPMYVVGLGPRTDSENAQDLWVQQVPEQVDVYTKNPVNIRGLLQCRGVANRDLIVKLMMIQPGKPPKELALDRIRPTRSDQSLPFRLPLIAPAEAGAYELLVRVDPVPGEAVDENNEAIVYLNVREGGARILYIEGEPRMESAFIRRAISENSDMQLSMLSISKPPNEKWPIDLSQRLSDGVYDCIILGDVDYKAIESNSARLIADQVKRGTGLVTLGGYFAYGPGGWHQSPLDEVLPVDLSNMRRQELNKPMDLQNHIAGPFQVVPTGTNDLLQIAAPEQNDATWRQLKPVLAANRWNGIKKSPGIVVHAETSQKQPLIVSGQADKGRVVCIAFDSTYLWWRQGMANEHKAFWRKMMYWCLRREATEEGMQLSMPQRRLMLQQAPEVTLQWNGGTKEVEMPRDIQMHLWRQSDSGDNATQPQHLGMVPLSRRDAKSQRAKFNGALTAGRYEWRASTIIDGKPVETQLPFVVVDESVESTQPMPDWQLMNQMAKLNASAGGALVAPEQAEDIVKQILDRRRQSTQTAIENRRLGDGVLDSWAAFVILTGALLAQWALRKRWNLP